MRRNFIQFYNTFVHVVSEVMDHPVQYNKKGNQFTVSIKHKNDILQVHIS